MNTVPHVRLPAMIKRLKQAVTFVLRPLKLLAPRATRGVFRKKIGVIDTLVRENRSVKREIASLEAERSRLLALLKERQETHEQTIATLRRENDKEKEAFREGVQADFRKEQKGYFTKKLYEEFPSIHWNWSLSRRRAVCPDGKFAFIMGPPNSGTTIFFRILLEHPEIWGLFRESNLFTMGHTDREIISTFKSWQKSAEQEGKSIVLEKTPTNIERWPRIHSLIPNHKILCMMRDGRDCVASGVASHHGSHEDAVNRWIDSVVEYETMQAAFKDDVILVHLRDLQQDPSLVLIRSLDFLGLSYDFHVLQKMLHYHERPRHLGDQRDIPMTLPQTRDTRRDRLQMRCYQVNQPVQKDTSRWKTEFPYDRHPELHERLAPWLAKYGYLDTRRDTREDSAENTVGPNMSAMMERTPEKTLEKTLEIDVNPVESAA